jgi:hypothetical protein
MAVALPGIAEVAATYAQTILAAVQQEYPNDLRHPMSGPDDRPKPHQIHPSFYGCYDWHSCVEMHWALVRLLRVVPEHLDQEQVVAVLDAHLSAAALASEADYFVSHPGFKRPYGWGWLLTLADELNRWDDAGAHRWSVAIEPLAAQIERLYLRWLPRATYPSRDGAHMNSAFGCARAIGWAKRRAAAGSPELLDAIDEAATRWFASDVDYPAVWEPSGADFLSAALAESELMSLLVDHERFIAWFRKFLPTLGSDPNHPLLHPAHVSDVTDGQIAHLHGLNLHRAHGLRLLAACLDAGDPLRATLNVAADAHLRASLPAGCGQHYMVEHWLACYAILALRGV